MEAATDFWEDEGDVRVERMGAPRRMWKGELKGGGGTDGGRWTAAKRDGEGLATAVASRWVAAR